jgi:hypothetical protein
MRLKSIGPLLGEAHFTVFSAQQGWDVYKGLDNTPCDFVVDTGVGKLIRVEVKCSISPLNTRKGRLTYVLKDIAPEKFDYLFISVPNSWYWIPSDRCRIGKVHERGGNIMVHVSRDLDARFGVTREYDEYAVSPQLN